MSEIKILKFLKINTGKDALMLLTGRNRNII
jgi:hypothetical protein